MQQKNSRTKLQNEKIIENSINDQAFHHQFFFYLSSYQKKIIKLSKLQKPSWSKKLTRLIFFLHPPENQTVKIIQDKWVYNSSSKPLINVEMLPPHLTLL